MKLYTRLGSKKLYVDLTNPITSSRLRWCTGETEQRAARKAAVNHLASLTRTAGASLGGVVATTIGTALERYLNAIVGKSSHGDLTALALKATGRHPAPATAGRWHLDHTRWLHTLSPVDLDDLVRARTAEGNSPQTIAHELKLLRTATRHAAGLGQRVPELLMSGAVQNAWRVPAVATKTRYLSIDEYRLVYDYLSPDRVVAPKAGLERPPAAYTLQGQRRAARQDVQDLLVALAMTGGRWNEVARLTWHQVDLEQRVVRLWGEKTQTERLAPLPDPAWAMLQRRAAVQTGPVVFPGAGGGFRCSASCQPILRAMEAVGLNTPAMVARHGRATVHSLRHTFASLLLQHGADLSEVQEALGHASLHMTRRYAHLAKHKATARLGAILTGITGAA